MHYTEPSLPFGGIGNSGMGSYHGEALGYMLYKTVGVNSTDFTGIEMS